MHRKKPFSGKAKKQQLKDKREKNRVKDARAAAAEEEAFLAAELGVAAGPVDAAAVAPDPPQLSGRGDLRTVFQLEPKDVVEARKKDATRPCVYAEDRGQSQSIYAYGIQDPQNQPPILRKPEWLHTMTTEELDAVDQAAYARWIAAMDSEQAERRAAGETDAVLNLYERNLEVWRQLWRVIERSSVLVLLADARCPLLHISDQLMDYLKTAFPSKRILLVLTKSDLVAPKRVQDWVEYLQQRYGQQIPVLAYSRENEDQSNAILMRTIGELSATVKLGKGEEYDDDETRTLTIGFVGEPNVGKSSLLNNLFGRKLVSVSATPGHTKHLQTHFFDRVEMLERQRCEIERVVVCDCPGVVFPRFNVPLSLQILFGSFPIAQTREPFSAIRFMAENCDPHLHEVYKLKPVEEDDGDWSPYLLCESYAKQRSFYIKGGRHDVHRAANQLLRDTLNGKKVVLSFPPPHC